MSTKDKKKLSHDDDQLLENFKTIREKLEVQESMMEWNRIYGTQFTDPHEFLANYSSNWKLKQIDIAPQVYAEEQQTAAKIQQNLFNRKAI
jgi:hypothetical protein